VPQTFTYAPSSSDRQASLVNLVASVFSSVPNTPRPNALQISFDVGGSTTILDPWSSANGPEWDSSTTAVTIPANSTQMTVQALSQGDGSGNQPASLSWAATALSIPNPPPPPPAVGTRTIGYWKNWASCSTSGGNQTPVLDQTIAAAGGSIQIGNLSVSSCTTAIRILNKSDVVTGQKRAADPAYNLAAQLLGAKLNLVAGSSACTAVTTAVGSAQALLVAINFTGTGPSTMTAAQAALANTLATTLDNYNNGLLC
jgi:hypothetical protein